jgi:hypothetical protein
MSKETAVERAQRITLELRAATSEGAAMLKDMRALLREVRSLLPAQAAAAVAGQVLPALESFNEQLTATITAAETEIATRFNETTEALDALMSDFAARGNIYRVGMPVVEGVKAVEEIINAAKHATRK